MKKLHRYLGLGAALLWLVQALTGVALVFRWEIDDATIAAERIAVDPVALGAGIEAIAREHGPVSSVWASGNAADRFTVFHTDGKDGRHVAHLDGAGRMLRDRPGDQLFAGGAIFDTLTRLHQSLFAGNAGKWIVGISGLLLLTNLALGLRLAWPRAGQWRRFLITKPDARTSAANFYGWHRLIGLWGAVPALLIVSAGVLLVFVDDLQDLLRSRIPAPITSASTLPPANPGEPIAIADALSKALHQYPGATISGVGMPTANAPWYQIRLRAPGEVPRIWGTTTLHVSAADGRIVGDHPASKAGPARTFVETLYPFHTGQIGGIAGRIALLLLGAWLIAMIVVGFNLWRTRRPAGSTIGTGG